MKSFANLKNKVSHATGQQPQSQGQEDDQSLVTLLHREQRAELSLLISQTAEQMRTDLVKCFDGKLTPVAKKEKAEKREEQEEHETIDLSTLNLSDPGSGLGTAREVRLEGDDHHGEEDEQPQPEDVSLTQTPETKVLRAAALTFFDTWAESVNLRVGEVVNSRELSEQNKDQKQTRQLAQSEKELYQPTPRERDVDHRLSSIYPPVSTPLSQLSHAERSTILKALLLLLLSLESYRAHSRTLLIRLCISLHLSAAELTKMETDISFALLTAAAKMDASSQTAKAQEKSAISRKWKVGMAGVAGAALIGITGGLAAPLLAAGVGTLMGGLGLGATAAAGYLGALAGNAVLVGGLFGAYGARMTSRTMDKYAKDIEDFAFLPVRGSLGDNEDKQKKRRRLRVIVAISGWLTQEEQVTLPWRVLGDGGEPFALRWELQALLNLGNALQNFVMSEAWSRIKKELIRRTIFAALWSALMAPLAIRKVLKLVDSPFGVAKGRALKAGEVLADAIVDRVQGERPISLVAQSLGARVVYSCLLALARRQAFGLVENVVLMGAAVPADEQAWRAMRSVVSGRLVNVYSSQDYILAFLYRTSSAQLGVAGVKSIEGVAGVENFDMSEQVPGHLAYMQRTGRVLEAVGWEDLDVEALRKEEMLLEQMEAEEEKNHVDGDDADRAEAKELKGAR